MPCCMMPDAHTSLAFCPVQSWHACTSCMYGLEKPIYVCLSSRIASGVCKKRSFGGTTEDP